MEALTQLEGSFAFVVYDKNYGRIVAARDVQVPALQQAAKDACDG